MTIRFYELTRDVTAIVGDIRLEGDRLIADPGNRAALVNLLAEPLEVYQEHAERTVIDPQTQPEAFLKGCLETFRGTYFWCREIPEPTDTDKRSI